MFLLEYVLVVNWNGIFIFEIYMDLFCLKIVFCFFLSQYMYTSDRNEIKLYCINILLCLENILYWIFNFQVERGGIIYCSILNIDFENSLLYFKFQF